MSTPDPTPAAAPLSIKLRATKMHPHTLLHLLQDLANDEPSRYTVKRTDLSMDASHPSHASFDFTDKTNPGGGYFTVNLKQLDHEWILVTDASGNPRHPEDNPIDLTVVLSGIHDLAIEKHHDDIGTLQYDQR